MHHPNAFNLILALLLLVPHASPFVAEEECRRLVVNQLDDKSLFPTDDQIFHRNREGALLSNKNSTIVLTLTGCRQKCGESWAAFPWEESIQKLSTWLIPVLLLLGTLHFPPLPALYNVFSVVHVLGDPIDAIWSMLTKREVTCRSLAFTQGRHRNAIGKRGYSYHRRGSREGCAL
jgi:hypothetical protein